MAEIPTNEQGYPSQTVSSLPRSADAQLGGCGWTWDTKQREIATLTDCLYQIGWGKVKHLRDLVSAWADVGDVVEAVLLTMERMTPSPVQLQAYRGQISESIARQRELVEKEGNDAIDAGLRFWPPTWVIFRSKTHRSPVTQLVERAIKRLAITDGQSPNK